MLTKSVCFLITALLFGRSLHAETKPNIVVILTDDQGWGDIGYNNPRVYSPNMDKLAAEGAVLSQHYVTAQCTPTRLALLTGRYPGRFGTTGLQASNLPIIPHGTLTLASFLKSQGYKTYLTGKWHLGTSPEHGPNHHGFDYSYGALTGAVGAYEHFYRNNAITWHRNHKFLDGSENGRHVTDLVTEDAIRVIKKEHDSPFFLYLPYFAPHTPLDERDENPQVPTQLDADNPERWYGEDENRWFNDPEGIIQQEKDPEKRLFLAVVHHLDDAIGQVVSALDESGKRDNTIIFFSSDNGPQVSWGGGAYPSDLRLTNFNQPIPFRGSKQHVYEGGIRVPGFVNWPKQITPGTIDSVLHIVDWLPTIAGIIGADLQVPEEQPAMDGIDFSQLLLSKEVSVEAEREIYTIQNTKTNRWSLRHGKWKIVAYQPQVPESDAWELYNLTQDSREKNDVAKENADIVAKLHERFLIQYEQDKKEPNFNKKN